MLRRSSLEQEKQLRMEMDVPREAGAFMSRDALCS